MRWLRFSRRFEFEVAVAAIEAVAELDAARVRLYCDLILASLSDANRKALEARMATSKYEYQSDFARKYVAQGVAQGRAEARAEAIITMLEEPRSQSRTCRVPKSPDAPIPNFYARGFEKP